MAFLATTTTTPRPSTHRSISAAAPPVPLVEPPSPHAVEQAAAVFGPEYQVVRQIGSGGMGLVYEVLHVHLGSYFVLKALRSDWLDNPDLIGRLRLEWQVLGQLNHRSIVRVTDAGFASDGTPFYVMERVPGETLQAAMVRGSGLSWLHSLDIIGELGSALMAIHAMGIVHRDIKPSNIMLLPDGSIKLLDFGLAKRLEAWNVNSTSSGVRLGTPRYMSPEQVRGEPISAASDYYAIGLLLFELFGRHHPFAACRGVSEMMLAHGYSPAPRLDDVVPNVPGELARLVAALLSKHPDERMAASQNLHATLARVRDTLLSEHTLVEPAAFEQPTSSPTEISVATVTESDLYPPAKSPPAKFLPWWPRTVRGAGTMALLFTLTLSFGVLGALATTHLVKHGASSFHH
jgi:serine/threonine protein kinase